MGLFKIVRFFFIPLSIVYFWIISFRNFLYSRNIFKTHTLDAKVISVGNITWGGTGKTPLALFILKEVLDKNLNPSVLMRGYGGDEANLFSASSSGVPVILGKDRVVSGKKAISQYASRVLLLDDGFQYRRLKRDLDVVCIDATNPFGNNRVIPSGIMREGFSALKRADIFMITKVNLVEDKDSLKGLEIKLKKINPDALIVKSAYRLEGFRDLLDGKEVTLDQLKERKVVLVSGIGSPGSFERSISSLGIKIKRHFAFRDHHWYTKKDLESIEKFCKDSSIDTVITTQKDRVRLLALGDKSGKPRYFIASLKLDIIENEKGFYNRLSGIFDR